MKSTMQDAQLTIGSLMRHGTTVHADAEVVTATADGVAHPVVRRARPPGRAAGQRTAQPRHHRRPAGRRPSSGTTPSTSRPTSRSRRWARCCTPSTSGSSPSSWSTSPTTPRTRSSSSTTRWCRCWPSSCRSSTTVEPRAGRRARTPRRPTSTRCAPPARRCCSTRTCSPAQPEDVRLARGGRARRRGDVLHQRHHRQPEGRRLQPPLGLAALAWPSAPGNVGGLDQPRPGAADRADVPRQRLGPGLRRADDRRVAVHARPLAAGRAAGPVHRRRAGPPCPARCRRSGTTCSHYLDEHQDVEPVDSLRLILCGGSAVPVVAAEGARGAARHRRPCRPGA